MQKPSTSAKKTPLASIHSKYYQIWFSIKPAVSIAMEQYILQTFGKKKPDLTHKLITTEKKVILYETVAL